MNSALGPLRSALAREDTVLFIGSGVSVWSGLPTWTALIEALRDELVRLGRPSELVERELDGQDLLLAASYGFDLLSREERRMFLRSAVDLRAEPSELHRLVAGLGPSCFVTTNYDDLVEKTLRDSRRGEHFDVVTAAHTLEIPSIIRARADHFVFKPHGDIGNAESVVLTREDYRQLQSANRGVFDAVRTLLASRPVVYIGFGLRDPDFLLMRDMLFGTFHSNPSDHFAIMPDVHEAERAYWIRNHGIDLISYDTVEGAVGTARHAKLLDVLRAASAVPAASASPVEDPSRGAATLTLARYARGLRASLGDDETTDFPLTIRAKQVPDGMPHGSLRLDGEAIRVLSAFQGHAVIEGPPGCGKSHTVRKLARHLACELEDNCLSLEPSAGSRMRVPVVVSLRDYRGSVRELIDTALPHDLSVDALLKDRKAVLVLDGANEAPMGGDGRDGELVPQLAELLKAAQLSTVLITTRFAGHLSSLEIPVAILDAVGESALNGAIEEAGLDRTRLNPVTFDLLRRPLFYSAWRQGQLTISETQTIHDVYAQIELKLQAEVSERLGRPMDLGEALGRVAFGMIDSGDLSAPLAQVLLSLGQSVPESLSSAEMYEALVAAGVLLPTPLRRLVFYHHSVAEYFAARYLARQIAQDPAVVVRCLGRTDWDQTLLMCLAFLPSGLADQVHETVMRTDGALGLRGLHYVEADQDIWIERALDRIPDRDFEFPESTEICDALASLPLGRQHLAALNRLVLRRDDIGGTALAIAASLDDSHLEAALVSIAEGIHGYNYCNQLARELSTRISPSVALRVFDALDRVSVDESDAQAVLAGDEIYAIVCSQSAAAELVEDAPTEALLQRATRAARSLTRMVAVRALHDRRNPDVALLIREEIEAGHNYAVWDHYMQYAFAEPEGVELPPASSALLNRLIELFANQRMGHWAVELIQRIVEEDLNARRFVQARVGESTGLIACLLAHAVGDQQTFADLFRGMIRGGADWGAEPTHCLQAVEDWEAPLLVEALRTRKVVLAEPLLEAVVFRSGMEPLGAEIGDVDWWLDWMDELEDDNFWVAGRLGSFLAESTTRAARDYFVDAFNNRPGQRCIIARHILCRIHDVNRGELSDSAVEWLLGNISANVDVGSSAILAEIASEDLVQERLMPQYLLETDVSQRTRIANLLEVIGRRHGRRYIGDDGEALA